MNELNKFDNYIKKIIFKLRIFIKLNESRREVTIPRRNRSILRK